MGNRPMGEGTPAEGILAVGTAVHDNLVRGNRDPYVSITEGLGSPTDRGRAREDMVDHLNHDISNVGLSGGCQKSINWKRGE